VQSVHSDRNPRAGVDETWTIKAHYALNARCSVAQRSRLIPLSVSPNSDKSGKQSLYSDGDPDRHRNLIICSLAHCQPSLKISCKSVWKFLRKVANSQTNNNENISALAEVIMHRKGQYALRVHTGRTYGPYLQPVCTALMYVSAFKVKCKSVYIVRRQSL